MNQNAPKNSVALTVRDNLLLEAVSCKVKLLSFRQVRQTWWAASRNDREMRRRLALLERAGLIQCIRVMACEHCAVSTPLASWRPGDADVPDLRKAVSLARQRWSGSLQLVAAVLATQRGADLMGGKARRVRPSEGSHDLHLAQVYLRKLLHSPVDAEAWIGEAQWVADAQGKEETIPDAVMRKRDGTTAVEVVGSSYAESKLIAFHAYCRVRDWRYELW